MKKVFNAFAFIFGALAVLLFRESQRELDIFKSTIMIANVPCTIYAAACGVVCIVNIIAAKLTSFIDEKNNKIISAVEKINNQPVPTVNGSNSKNTMQCDTHLDHAWSTSGGESVPNENSMPDPFYSVNSQNNR